LIKPNDYMWVWNENI